MKNPWTALMCMALLLLAFRVDVCAQRLRSGPDLAADGYLHVRPDDFGAWGDVMWRFDRFNPAGGLTSSSSLGRVASSSGFFVFVGGNQRELLVEPGAGFTWENFIGATSDTSLDRTVTVDGVVSDSSGNGVNDTRVSQFKVFGGPTDLTFDLTQMVSALTPGVSAFIRQDYTITNNASTPISLNMVRVFDGDLKWFGPFSRPWANDEVGTTMHPAGPLGTYIYMQEPEEPGITAVTVSSRDASEYFGSKSGVTPPGGPRFPECGTCAHQDIWDAYGIPVNWSDYIAGVGADVNGNSGPTPPGSFPDADAGLGLGFDLQLDPSQSTTVTVYHTFGQNTPVPEPSSLILWAGLVGGLCLGRSRSQACCT